MTSSEYLAACGVSLFVHELGHVVAALSLKVKVKKVGIAVRGPYIVREEGPPVANAVISGAGPFFNLLLAALTIHLWPTLALVNFVLGLANLIPTPTSDGRRVLQGLATAYNHASPPTIQR